MLGPRSIWPTGSEAQEWSHDPWVLTDLKQRLKLLETAVEQSVLTHDEELSDGKEFAIIPSVGKDAVPILHCRMSEGSDAARISIKILQLKCLYKFLQNC